MVTGGTYGITLKADTGEYAFGDPLKTNELLTPGSVSLYPNPTSTIVNLDIQDDRLLGDLDIEIIDFSGKLVLKTSINTNTQKTVDVSTLNTGNYMMRITNGKNLVGKKLSIQK